MKWFGSRSLGIFFFAALLTVVLPAASVHGQTEEPWQMIGVWNLNVERSPLFEGPPPQMRSLAYWWEDDQLRHTVHIVSAQGDHTSGGWTVDRNFQTLEPSRITLKRVDSHTSQVIVTEDGTIRQLLTRIVSRDGKTVTFVRTRPDENGVLTVFGVEVFDKQIY